MGLSNRQLINASIADGYLSEIKGWNLTASTVARHLLNGDRWLFPMNHVLCSIGQMDGCAYDIKCQKKTTLLQLVGGSKLEEAALWSGECFCGKVNGSMRVWVSPCRPCQPLHADCIFSAQ